jgi:large subunit ribosomal protein L22
MEVTARAKFVRRTPRKARLLADAVRGMTVAEALTYLEFSPKHAATDVAKVIKSATANAEHNFNLNRDDLYLKNILVDEGPTMKRIRPVSRGMAHQYFHRLCHITAIVEERPEPEPRRRVRRASPAAQAAPAAREPRDQEEEEEGVQA